MQIDMLSLVSTKSDLLATKKKKKKKEKKKKIIFTKIEIPGFVISAIINKL